MALGHPLGGTGAKLMTTLVNELERRGGRYGMQAICEGEHRRHHHRRTSAQSKL